MYQLNGISLILNNFGNTYFRTIYNKHYVSIAWQIKNKLYWNLIRT